MSVIVKFDSAKWARNASNSAGDYAKGAASPKRSPTAAAIASKDLMLAGIQQAVSSGRWEKRLSESGDAAYSAGVRDKGQTRYQQGVTAPRSMTKSTAFGQKLSSALAGVTLAPKGPKGTNYGNVQTVGDALMTAFGKK